MFRNIISKLRGDNMVDGLLKEQTSNISRNIQQATDSILRQRLAVQKMELLHVTNPVRGISEERYNGEEVIVSLTSHSKRIHQVYLAIESMMQQTMKANRIILWLDENNFSVNSLPLTLKKQMERGLEVRFVKDIRSYTKIIYALKEFPESNIITIDDDVIYAHDLVERLFVTHEKNPDCICCSFGRDLDSCKMPKKEISYNACCSTAGLKDHKSMSIVAEGFAGVLYPPHSLNEEVFNEEVFLKIAPSCDDLWLKAMSLLNNTNVVEMSKYLDWDKYNIDVTDCWDIGLRQENLGGSANDMQFHAVMKKYDLYDRW